MFNVFITCVENDFSMLRKNGLTQGKNMIYLINEFFTIKTANLFPELTSGVVQWIFCYKEGILMEIDPSSANCRRILNILLYRMTF